MELETLSIANNHNKAITLIKQELENAQDVDKKIKSGGIMVEQYAGFWLIPKFIPDDLLDSYISNLRAEPTNRMKQLSDL